MAEYKSPIEIALDGITMTVEKTVENEICESVQRAGINVDKRELIKALAYDREQYDKGYKQGYEDCQKEIEESLGLLWKGGVKNG